MNKPQYPLEVDFFLCILFVFPDVRNPTNDPRVTPLRQQQSSSGIVNMVIKCCLLVHKCELEILGLLSQGLLNKGHLLNITPHVKMLSCIHLPQFQSSLDAANVCMSEFLHPYLIGGQILEGTKIITCDFVNNKPKLCSFKERIILSKASYEDRIVTFGYILKKFVITKGDDQRRVYIIYDDKERIF